MRSKKVLCTMERTELKKLASKIVNVFLIIMIIILCLAIVLWIWSDWEHRRTLCMTCPATGIYSCRTGLDSVDLLTPLIGSIIFFVILPITSLTAFIAKKMKQSK